MKTDKTFKMPRKYKAMLASIVDPQMRLLWKRSFIEGTLYERDAKLAKYVEVRSSKGD